MTQRLTGRTALVTGSTAGIGAAIAAALAAEGAFVVVSGRDEHRGAEVVARIEKDGGAAAFVKADLSAGADAIGRFATDAVAAAGGRIDVLVNNAALLLAPAPTAEVAQETIDEALAVSVRSVFLLTGLLVPPMAERGHGAVVNLGSISGMRGMAHSALYSMTKAAVHSLTASWAAEYGPHGVRVNTVAPGPTLTEKVAAMEEHLAPIIAGMPSRRAGTPAEVAAAVVFLASDEASQVHGATLTVDGGFTAV
ncbi:SDR family oxidoreductase (plasmid) [Streptomyces sp. NBC_01340]|uniref:SDR family NAD(P)-dependent oxidoreductase n=1 Tax=unclassified Streptomyces TaxID=2593676 RepID=UPI00224FA376|nr:MULTISPECIES: SDR family oxidoreductase [unclassified Streptomyces]MCX4462293.1 SDR family oxidoreductase [Streptomyces sp. NBC_01719]MCX4500731.1 SDR family oxidoreductase [Streptomyces sp. NBC_01728]MCX4598688.1 SDR family oxidoreductase [Streptomyces sp. NBC_01549]WSI35939.1 SDR family oxidoreductase [Streptomyces sp. NBC_01340]WSI43873.1 SDR family oxidoreductase [Streptomyces sp. NBC_01340]